MNRFKKTILGVEKAILGVEKATIAKAIWERPQIPSYTCAVKNLVYICCFVVS